MMDEMSTTGSRPLDTLNAARNKSVMVDLKNNFRYIGKLIAFDIHVNIVLADAEEYNAENVKVVKKVDENTTEESYRSEMKPRRKVGTVFLRGDTITVISPA